MELDGLCHECQSRQYGPDPDYCDECYTRIYGHPCAVEGCGNKGRHEKQNGDWYCTPHDDELEDGPAIDDHDEHMNRQMEL